MIGGARRSYIPADGSAAAEAPGPGAASGGGAVTGRGGAERASGAERAGGLAGPAAPQAAEDEQRRRQSRALQFFDRFPEQIQGQASCWLAALSTRLSPHHAALLLQQARSPAPLPLLCYNVCPPLLCLEHFLPCPARSSPASPHPALPLLHLPPPQTLRPCTLRFNAALIAGTDPGTITEHGQFFREPGSCGVWGEGRVRRLEQVWPGSGEACIPGVLQLDGAAQDVQGMGAGCPGHGRMMSRAWAQAAWPQLGTSRPGALACHTWRRREAPRRVEGRHEGGRHAAPHWTWFACAAPQPCLRGPARGAHILVPSGPELTLG